MRWKVAFLSLLAVAGCTQSPSTTQPDVSTLQAGTEVRLVLLKELSSGAAPENSRVPMLVLDDVLADDGHAAIALGTLAFANVRWSRAGSLVSTLENRPARLSITFDRTLAVDGQPVRLEANPEKPGDAFQFTPANTSKKEVSVAVQELVRTPEGREAAEKIRAMFAEGGAPSVSEEYFNSLVLERLRLPSARVLSKKGELNKAFDLLREAAAGKLTRIAGPEAEFTVRALQEFADVANQAGNILESKFKGRNLKAYAGTPLVAYVGETVTLRPSK